MFRPVIRSQSTGGLPGGGISIDSAGATTGAAAVGGGAAGSVSGLAAIWLNAHSASPRSAGSCCSRCQRLPCRACFRADAAQRAGREDAHVEEFVAQRFDQVRHRGVCRGTDTRERFARCPSDARNGIANRSREVRGGRSRHRADRRQRLRRVDADVWIRVRESLDQRGDRWSGLRPQRSQGTGGIAGNFRILVSQCPSQRRLDRFRIRRQVDERVNGVAADRGRDYREADPPAAAWPADRSAG